MKTHLFVKAKITYHENHLLPSGSPHELFWWFLPNSKPQFLLAWCCWVEGEVDILEKQGLRLVLETLEVCSWPANLTSSIPAFFSVVTPTYKESGNWHSLDTDCRVASGTNPDLWYVGNYSKEINLYRGEWYFYVTPLKIGPIGHTAAVEFILSGVTSY